MSGFSSILDPHFETNLILSLKLESDGKEVELPSGNIEEFILDLYTYGHTCKLQFCTFGKDDIDEVFNAPKMMKATIAFKPLDSNLGTEPVLEIKGIVTDKSFTRMPATKGKEEQAHRLYEIYFCDSAKAIWEQHYPSNIYLEDSMKDVFEKHVNPEIKMNYDWDPLEAKHPITALSLEHKHWLPAHEQTNFYSFLIWYLHQENGILAYDYKTHSYAITGKKKESSEPPLEVPEWLAMPPNTASFPGFPAITQKSLCIPLRQ